MFFFLCNLVKNRLIEFKKVGCVWPLPAFRGLTNNGQKTFKLKKVNFQDYGPADNDPNLQVFRN